MRLCESRDEKSIDAAAQMFRRYVLIKVEGIKQSVLLAAVFSHHAGALPPPAEPHSPRAVT